MGNFNRSLFEKKKKYNLSFELLSIYEVITIWKWKIIFWNPKWKHPFSYWQKLCILFIYINTAAAFWPADFHRKCEKEMYKSDKLLFPLFWQIKYILYLFFHTHKKVIEMIICGNW